MILAWENRVASASLTASAQEALLPVDNLQRAPVARVWRASGTSAYVDADFGSDVTLQDFVAAGVNLTAAATHRIQLSDTAAGSDEVLDTGTISAGIAAGYNKVLYSHASELSARYMRWTFSDATLGAIDVGYLFAGPGWRPTRNFSYGAGVRWVDPAGEEAAETLGGQLIYPSRARYRAIDFALEANGPAEMLTNALELDRLRGTSEPLLVRLDPTNYPQQLSVFGSLVRPSALVWGGFATMAKRYTVRDWL